MKTATNTNKKGISALSSRISKQDRASSNGKATEDVMENDTPPKENNAGNLASSPTYLQKFFIDMLKDIYYAEKELVKGLQEMKNAVSTEELQDAFEEHTHQTERHIKRLEQVFKLVHLTPETKTCEAMNGLLKEARSIINETEDGTYTRDAALIIAAQKIEHYEIATYGGLVQLAATMNLSRAAEILDKTLQEEEETDSRLTDIAECNINIEAEHEGGYAWQKQEAAAK